ncbi:MAG: RNA polymerase sigma factor [Verrucomicrobiota bacterium]
MIANLEEHINSNYKNLYYFALSLTKNEADACDLTQHAFLKLAKNVNKIRDDKKVKSWLFSTLYRDFIDGKRRSRFQADQPFEEAAGNMHSESPPSDNRLDSQAVLKILIKLDDDLRIPLTLFYLEDYSYKEIAKLLKIPMGTVMSRLHRGKELLYQTLIQLDNPNRPISGVSQI